MQLARTGGRGHGGAISPLQLSLNGMRDDPCMRSYSTAGMAILRSTKV